MKRRALHTWKNIVFLLVIVSFVMIGYGNSYILAEGNIGGESYSDMKKTTQGLTPPEPSESATPEKIQGPKEVIPYEFEQDIPFIAKEGQPLTAMTLPQFAKKLIKVAFLIAGILAFSMIVWGGYEYLTSGGNSTKQQSAFQRITYAIIGLILLFAFWIILNTINPDILKTTDLKQGIKESEEENGDGGDNIPSDTQQLATLLWGHENIQWYDGADRDIQDMINGTPINVYENDPNGSNPQYNCLDKVEEAEGFATTIDARILRTLLEITDTTYTGTCGNYEIGPFISNHNYCNNPYSFHAKGKAVDITLLGKTLTNQDCTQELLSRLCPDKDPTQNCQEGSMFCEATVGGVTVQIWNGTCTGEPHLHIQVP